MKQNYPYIKDKHLLDKKTQKKLHRYLSNIVRPLVHDKKISTNHVSAQSMIKYIDARRKQYPYFLKFDFSKYYVDIRHDSLLASIDKICVDRQYNPGKIGKHYLRTLLPYYLSGSPFRNQSIPTGSTLSGILSNIYLYELDMAIASPFTRYVDDVMVLFKTNKELEYFVENILIPLCEKLTLTLHPSKLQSGKFSKESVEYLGFKFSRGIISISDVSIEKFKIKIKQATSLQHKQTLDSLIGQLNPKIDAFGHFYKIGRVSKVYTQLDKMIRQRVRRYAASSVIKTDSTSHFQWTLQRLDASGLHRLCIILDTQPQNKFTKKSKIDTHATSIKQDILRIERKLDLLLSLQGKDVYGV